MILTITLNPSIDIRYNLDNFVLGNVNRVLEYEKTAGGKGLNVSRVIKKLGVNVLATGLLGGKIGEDLKHKLDIIGIENDFEQIGGETRNCINVLHNNMSTEILESGPTITSDEWNNFKNKFLSLINKYKYITASGSIPSGLSNESYSELIDIANNNAAKFFLDTSGNALKHSLNSKPYFIKPNLEELEKLTNKTLNNLDDIIYEAEKLHNNGVSIVAVTLGKDGSILISEQGILIAKIPTVKVLNTVGCGDSFVAGFASGIYKNMDIIDAFKLAISCSISNALLEGTGNIDINIVNKLINEIEIVQK